MHKTAIWQKAALILFGLFLCVVLIEAGLRAGGFIFLSAQEFSNRASLKQEGAYRILCLGESMTACGGSDSYPSQLGEILNRKNIGTKFSVINKGVPGTETRAILVQLNGYLNKYRPKMVISMMGINDLSYLDEAESPVLYSEKNSGKKIKKILREFRVYKLFKLIWLKVKSKGAFVKTADAGQPRYKEYISLGRKYTREGVYKEAEKMFKKAIAANPSDEKAYIELGWCYKHQGKLGEAEGVLKKAIGLNPKSYRPYFVLGMCYRDEKRYYESEKVFGRGLELNPRIEELYHALGGSYAYQGKMGEAKKMYQKALEINPYQDRLYGRLALIYEKEGRHELAKDFFKKADKLRMTAFNTYTRGNYEKLHKILEKRGIILACASYPTRSIMPLKETFKGYDNVIFIDDEKIFKDALRRGKYYDYFLDDFAGDFGHCTKKGNRLLAENIAKTILKECSNYAEPD